MMAARSAQICPHVRFPPAHFDAARHQGMIFLHEPAAYRLHPPAAEFQKDSAQFGAQFAQLAGAGRSHGNGMCEWTGNTVVTTRRAQSQVSNRLQARRLT